MAAMTNGTSQHGAQHAAAGATGGDDDVKALRNRYEYTRYGDNLKNELIEVRFHPPTWRERHAEHAERALTLLQDVLKRYETLVQTHKDYVEAHQQEREAAQTSITTIRGLQNSVGHLQNLLVS